eukprot:3200644-Lingulodinium_polyedra.AAC.1
MQHRSWALGCLLQPLLEGLGPIPPELDVELLGRLLGLQLQIGQLRPRALTGLVGGQRRKD